MVLLLRQLNHVFFLKWLQRYSSPQPLNSQTNTQPFHQTGQTIKLVNPCIWLYVFSMSHERFGSESTLYSCLNAKELLVRNRRDIWSLSDCNRTRTHNHLVRKRTLNHLAAHRTYEYSQHSSIIWPVWSNGWVLVYKLRVVVGSNTKPQISRLFRARSSLTFRQL